MCDNIQTRPSFYVNHFVHATFFLVSIGHVDQFSPSPMAFPMAFLSMSIGVKYRKTIKLY